MKWFEALPKTLAEVRKLVREFRESPFRAAKALIIIAIILVCLITQWSGYEQEVSYGWMIGGVFLLIMVLLIVLRIAFRFGRQET